MSEREAGSRTTARRTDEVHAALRADILRGVLRPHEQLVEGEIAERLGVSRTPVREGLQRLEADGLIVSRRRRWFVYAHSREEVQSIYELRMAIEGFAARLAAQRATGEQRTALRRLVDERTPDAVTTPEEYLAFNTLFHRSIVDASNNAHFTALDERNRSYGFNLQIAATYSRTDIAEANEEHEQILGAIERNDAAAAEQAARDHVEKAGRIALQRLNL